MTDFRKISKTSLWSQMSGLGLIQELSFRYLNYTESGFGIIRILFDVKNVNQGEVTMRINMTKSGVISLKAVLVSAFCLTSFTALACGQDAYFGQVCIMAGPYCPQNTLPAEGQLLPISGNEALYSVLGTTYGGDARTNFALPDLRGRVPVGQGQGPGLSRHNMGVKFGNETIIQTLAQMPQHMHTAVFTPSGGGGSAATVSVLSTQGAGTLSVPQEGSILAASLASGGSSANIYAPPGTTGPTVKLGGVSGGGGTSGGGTVTVGNMGGNQPMTIVPPEISIRYCIVTNGLYPERPN